MGWLRLVGSLKLQVSFAKEPYKRDFILQKRPVILSILPTEATPWVISHTRSRTYAWNHLLCDTLCLSLFMARCIHLLYDILCMSLVMARCIHFVVKISHVTHSLMDREILCIHVVVRISLVTHKIMKHDILCIHVVVRISHVTHYLMNREILCTSLIIWYIMYFACYGTMHSRSGQNKSRHT